MTNKMSALKLNPWSSEDSATTSLWNALLLAERMGYVMNKHDGDDDKIPSQLTEMASIKQIKLQREVTRLKKELSRINLEIHKRAQDYEAKDITHLDVIEKRTEELKQLNDHLQSVISNKDFIVTRLQQPFTGDFIAIRLEAAFHRYAQELFVQLAPVLSSLSSHFDDIMWLRQHDFTDGVLENQIMELSSVLANLQTRFQAALQLSHHISLLHNGEVHRTPS